ncbi:hypothetical protein GCM10007071_10630 [Marinobacter zhanjiangensis]|uniref:Uncharacterized protein n=1 Tax=Marinobacter zhanjiangensis TaxID=578215 RepID=A0ABQ3AVD8_9GAMM|nr:hypothetical protein GCM10007071_10630 [Marinobacter zhanjiangensis]
MVAESTDNKDERQARDFPEIPEIKYHWDCQDQQRYPRLQPGKIQNANPPAIGLDQRNEAQRREQQNDQKH